VTSAEGEHHITYIPHFIHCELGDEPTRHLTKKGVKKVSLET
jgi:hypothetical protein